MSELTREQIEDWRIAWLNDCLKPEVYAELNALCDMALRSLAPDSAGTEPDESCEVMWRREWDGDVSDLGNFVYANTRDELDEHGPWEKFYSETYVDKLRTHARASARDAGRLDWLDEQMQRVYVARNKTRYSTPTDICIALGGVAIYQRDEVGNNANQGHGDTIRAAIDAAIDAANQEAGK